MEHEGQDLAERERQDKEKAKVNKARQKRQGVLTGKAKKKTSKEEAPKPEAA